MSKPTKRGQCYANTRLASKPQQRATQEGTKLRYEPLEPRIALSGNDVIDFTPEPSGALDGKIVYTSAGHGWEWGSGGFTTNRPDSNEIVEPFGNQDQMTFFADYLLRAGATVVPMRPIGNQLNEVVLDNDSPGVTFAGSWSDTLGTVFYDEDYGTSADSVGYRFASINANETATATYTPNIPEAGFYPVYTWVLNSGNRTDQLYRINHSDGGVTEIRVDHRQVGKGWVYLGTYHFDAGTSGNVVISNQSTAGGSVVIADAIRFGNGIGDMLDGPNGIGHPSGSTTGQPREDEAALLWTYRAIGQGNNPASILGTSNVSAPHLMAEHMNSNANPFGTSVYIGFHSNAFNGSARGAVGLWNASASARTPNQSSLATFVGRQINDDMIALNGLFEHNWQGRSPATNFQNFGEIDGGPNAEMDMTIIETGFHDNVLDAQLMRDPKVRDQMARSTYEAVVEYFSNFGGLTDTTSVPSAPDHVTASVEPDGDVTVTWEPGPTGVQGGTATGYRVYVSRNGYSYLGYDEVAGAGSRSHTFDAAELDGDPYYFKVVAVNSAGESPRSIVAAAQQPAAGSGNVLIVDGFDRNDRFLNERYEYLPAPDDLTDRVRFRYNNTRDYSIQVAEAIEAHSGDLGISTTSNEALIAGDVSLEDFDAVVWISGEESSADDTFNGTEQTLVTNYLAAGGKLFVSGAEIGWDLDNLNNGRSFYNNQLKANYVSDDANTYDVQGSVGSIFQGLSFSFDDGSTFYNSEFPDRISPLGGATTALDYIDGSGGNAAIQFDGGDTKLVNFGFPFETITTEADRAAVMDRVLEFFDLNAASADFNADGSVDGEDFLSWQRGVSDPGPIELEDGDANADGQVNDVDLQIWVDQYGQAAAAASLATSHSLASSEATPVVPDLGELAATLVRTSDSNAADGFDRDASDQDSALQSVADEAFAYFAFAPTPTVATSRGDYEPPTRRLDESEASTAEPTHGLPESLQISWQ